MDREIVFLRSQWVELRLVGEVTEQQISGDVGKNRVSGRLKRTSSTRHGPGDKPGLVAHRPDDLSWGDAEETHISDSEQGQETIQLWVNELISA